MANARLTHRERLEACLSGGKLDRPPVALWRHFPGDDQDPLALAKASAAFQRDFDFDLVKVTPASSFCTKDWGTQDEWRGDPEGTRTYTRRVIHTPEDWFKLAPLDPSRGLISGPLTTIQWLSKEFGPDLPILQTIFSPLSQAKNLVGPENLITHVRQYPQAVHAGLKTITEGAIRLIEMAAHLGIAGIFYAVQQAQYSLLTPAEFQSFGKAYDLEILQVADRLWLNMLHLHGENVMFDQVTDYPVQIINWHDRHTPPSLAEAQTRFPGIVCGGLRRWETMVLGEQDQVRAEVRDSIEQTGGTRLLLGTGCVLPIIAPYGNIMAARQAVEEYHS